MAEEKERTWGEATEDVIENTFRAMADGKRGVAVLGALYDAAANTEHYQRQQELEDMNYRMAKLAYQDALSQSEREAAHFARQQQEWKQDDKKFKIDTALALADLADRREARADRQAEREEWQANAENRQRLNDAAVRGEEAKADTAESEAEVARINTQMVRQQSWSNQINSDFMFAQNFLRQKIGYDTLNIYGLEYFDNSPNVEAFLEMSTVLKAYSRSDEEGDFALHNAGWSREVRTNPETGESETWIVSDVGDLEMLLTPESMQAVMKNIQEKLHNDILATYAQGTDATTLEQIAIRRTINNKDVLSAFGDQGVAVGEYQSFISRTVKGVDGEMVPKYTRADMIGHLLSENLQEALLDGKMTQEEKQFLMPLFVSSVKTMGGEVLLGESVETTKVKLRNGAEIPILQFASDISKLDRIGQDWRNYVAEKNNEKVNTENKNITPHEWGYLASLYGDDFKRLSEEDQNKFVGVMIDAEAQKNKVLPDGQSVKDLTLDDLRLLDGMWQELVDDADLSVKAFYSPYQNEIFLRERELLYKEKALLIAELIELENTPSTSRGTFYGPGPGAGNRIPTEENAKNYKLQGQISNLRDQIDKINDSIKMREEALDRRGIELPSMEQ